MANIKRIPTDMVEDRVTKTKLKDSLTAINTSLADIATMKSSNETYVKNPDGSIQSYTLKDSNNNVIKTETYTYNTDGDVLTKGVVMNGKTLTTTYTYDTFGDIQGINSTLS